MEFAINYYAVITAAVATIVFGALWFGPVFGGIWMKLMGFTKESMKAMPLSAGQAMAGGVVTAFLKAYVLAHVAIAFGPMAVGVEGAFALAFWMWLGFVMPTVAHAWLWEGKSFNLFAFKAVHGFIELLLMALILVLWV